MLAGPRLASEGSNDAQDCCSAIHGNSVQLEVRTANSNGRSRLQRLENEDKRIVGATVSDGARMRSKYWCERAVSVLAIALLASCASTPERPPSKANESGKPAPELSDIRIGHPKDGYQVWFGYYVLIKKIGGSWSVDAIEPANHSKLRDPTARIGQDSEVIYVSENLKYVRPYFYVNETAQSTKEAAEGRFTCFITDIADKTKTGYPDACNSDLTSAVDTASNAAKQVAGAIITLGLSTLATNKIRSVDSAKVLAAMKSADVISKVRYAQYAIRFKEAETSSELQRFIGLYRDYDPDGLVSKAQAVLPAQIEKERLLAVQRAKDEALAAERQRLQAEVAADARLRRARQFELRTAQFRKSLQAGDESHCGLVIEVKGPLVRLQTMIGEYWMRIDQVYGADDRDCRFINGKYVE